MEITLTLNNAKELQRTFRKYPAIASKEYNKSLERIAAHVVRGAVKNAPVNKGGGGGKKGFGGNLQQSIRYMPFGGSAFIVRVGADYGVYVDQGTRPHVITPKSKPFLVFKTKSGAWVKTRKVNHPGTKATHFFTNAVKDSERFADREMSRAMSRVINQL